MGGRQRQYGRRRGVLALTFLILLGSAQPQAKAAVPFRPPIDHPQVLHSFHLPHRFGPGHRGVDFAGTPGTVIRAAANGTVTFAGIVATRTWVSLQHADGQVTSYGPLTDVTVRAGDHVAGGEAIARLAAGGHGRNGADVGLHFSLRHNGTYRDPMALFPHLFATVTLVGATLWQAGGAPQRAAGGWRGNRLGGLIVAGSDRAELPHRFVPPNANHLVMISGLASDSESTMFDPALLGYRPDSVTYFSYAEDGGTFGPEHTWGGPYAVIPRLLATLREIARAQPGRPVDLVAHSQGGVLALHLLMEYGGLIDPTLPGINSIILLNSPVHGADVAALGVMVLDELGFGPVLTKAQRATRLGVNTLPVDAPAIRDLDTRDLRRRAFHDDWENAWQQALDAHPTGPMVFRPTIASFAGQHDGVVTKRRTRVTRRGMSDDARQHLIERTLPGGHASAKHTDALIEVVGNVLAGEPVVAADGHLSAAAGGMFSALVDATRFVTHTLRWPRTRP